MSSLGERLEEIENRISIAAKSAGRSREELELIVVSKNHPAQLVLDLLELGVSSFGENRDQEARPKAELVALQTNSKINWHFIGQLQSNKVKSVITYASAIHSLDRESLLESLVKVTASEPGPIDVFIQLNLTSDFGRGGIEPANLKRFAEQVLAAPNLNLLGVMGVASLDNQLERDFGLIQAASQDLQTLAPAAKFISAGMSDDFETAIGYGATHLRIGSAITGKRQF